MWWHIITFSIIFIFLLIQQWQLNKMSHRIFSNEEITEKIRQGVLLCLRGPGELPPVPQDDVKTE